MRKRGRVDANQSKIVKELRQAGYSVAVTSSIGKGFPDIVVGKHGRNWMFEIKDPSRSPSERKLTADEADFAATWKGHWACIETTEDALAQMSIT